MSSDVSQTPSGELGIRRVAASSSTDFASVEYLVSKASIATAWKKVRANKGAPGVDRVSIEGFPKWARPKWDIIKRQLLSGAYQPSAALRVEIPKESGGVRLLGIPCVMDRVLMQAIYHPLTTLIYPLSTQRRGPAVGDSQRLRRNNNQTMKKGEILTDDEHLE